MSYLFTAIDSDYRCFVPKCDEELNPNYDSNWIRNAIPSNAAGKLRKCEMYAKISENGDCSVENFNTTKIERCSSHIFKDDEYYIDRNYNILCEENSWKLSLVGSIHTIGMAFGAPIIGYFSDRYGRKTLLLAGMTLGSIAGLLRLVSLTFEWFCVFEFSAALLTSGCYLSAQILAVELVIPKYRTYIVSISNVFHSIGQILVAVIAWIWKDWRIVVYVIYIPPTFSICLYWFIPESIRWLSSKGKLEEAMKTLLKFTNEKTVPRSYFHALQRSILEKEDKNKAISIFKMVKSIKLLMRLINCCIIWATCMLVWYGLIMYSMELTENPYLNICLTSISEIAASFTISNLAGKFGRKTFLRGVNALAALCCFACILIESKFLSIVIYCLGKYWSTMNLLVLMTVTTEIFPTPLRQSTMAICSMTGRFGQALSPQTPLLSNLWQPLPLIVFGLASLVSAMLAGFLPETLNIKLPDTIEEAENIGEKPREIELNDM